MTLGLPSRFLIIFFCFISCAPLLLASEGFGNNSVSLPRVGVTFFDQSFITHKKPWGIGQQWMVGTAFKKALSYRWWWIAETDFGMGALSAAPKGYLSTFFGGSGIRFNFQEGNIRPYSGLVFHYLHFLGDNTKKLPLDIDWPIWVGLKPALGLEWFFYAEMAVMLEGAYGFYINIKEPFRHALFVNASYVLYF